MQSHDAASLQGAATPNPIKMLHTCGLAHRHSSFEHVSASQTLYRSKHALLTPPRDPYRLVIVVHGRSRLIILRGRPSLPRAAHLRWGMKIPFFPFSSLDMYGSSISRMVGHVRRGHSRCRTTACKAGPSGTSSVQTKKRRFLFCPTLTWVALKTTTSTVRNFRLS